MSDIYLVPHMCLSLYIISNFISVLSQCFSFVTNQNLKTHLKTHLKENQHKCRFCEFSCRTKVGLDNHCIKEHEQVSWNTCLYLFRFRLRPIGPLCLYPVPELSWTGVAEMAYGVLHKTFICLITKDRTEFELELVLGIFTWQ